MSAKLIQEWRRFVKSGEIAEIARSAGFGERKRKLTPRRVFWGMVMGFGSAKKRSLAGLTRFIGMISGFPLSRQAFHQRLTDRTADFFRRCFKRLSHRATKIIQEKLPGSLSSFEDLVLLDGSVIGLVERLAGLYPACRTNSRKAALKVHALMSLSEQQAQQIEITGERVPDGKMAKAGKWVKNRLLIFDLAYLDYGFLGDILRSGGAYACRLKTTSNGTIARVRRGCPMRYVGGELNRHIYRGPVVDIDVRFGRGNKTLDSRVVAIWNPEKKQYHWYTTSLDPETFPPDEVAHVYRLRWQIELLFKEWKSLQRLCDLPSGDESIVQCLLYATLCASVLSRLALWLSTQISHLPWFEMSTPISVSVFANYAFELAREVLKGRTKGLLSVLDSLIEALAVHAHTPNNTNAILSFSESGG